MYINQRLIDNKKTCFFLRQIYFLYIKFILIAVFIFSSIANAITLDEARQNHWVGETFSGYIAKTDNEIHLKAVSNNLLDAFINDINSKRHDAYSALASKNSLSTEIIAKIAGQKLIANTPKDFWVKGINGQWVKKD